MRPCKLKASYNANHLIKIKAGILSGIAIGLSFLNLDAIPNGIIIWFAFIPFLLALRHTTSTRQFIILSLAVIIPWVFIAVWWIIVPSQVAAIPLILLIIVLLSIHFIAVWILRKIASWKIAVLMFPFVWTGWEWINMHIPFSSGWLVLAHTHSTFWKLNQFADLLGIWGISFWILSINVGLTLFINSFQIMKIGAKSFQLWVIKLGLFLIIILGAAWIYSDLKITEVESSTSKFSITLVQPNTEPEDRWNRKFWNEQFDKLITMTDVAVKEARPDLIVWPEMSIPWFILDDPDSSNYLLLHELVRSWNITLVFGFPDVEDTTINSDDFLTYNAAAILSPDKDIDIYHKNRLLPFVEIIPFKEEIPFLKQFQVSVGLPVLWEKGKTKDNFKFRSNSGVNVAMGIGICYEQLFPDFTAESVNNGANLLLFITNDGWFGKTPMLSQAANISRLRCIETGRWMIRSSSNGISQIIDDYGRIVSVAPSWEPFLLSEFVYIKDYQTFYSKYPDLFAKFCVVFSILVFIILISKKYNKNKLIHNK